MFEFLKLGTELAGVAKEMNDIRLAMKNYPNDYPIFSDFEKSFIEMGLVNRNTKLSDYMAVISKQRLKGLSMKDMKCMAVVFPQQKNIAALFIPDVFVDSSLKPVSSEFVALVNANLPVGCVNITGTSATFMRGESLTFNYLISMSYKAISRPSKKFLLNMTRNLVDSAEFLPRCLEKIQLGESPTNIIKETPLIGKEPKPTPLKDTNFLLSALTQCIQAESLAIKSTSSQGILNYSDEAEEPIIRLAYVTAQHQIVFETQLQTISDLEIKQNMASFMVMANQSAAPTGKLTINLANVSFVQIEP